MSLVYAVACRLFAGKRKRSASLGIRTLLFVGSLLVVAYVVHRVTPVALPVYSAPQRLSLVFASTFLGMTLLYIFTDGAQKVFMQRLLILQQLPLTNGRLRALQFLAYLPITLAGGVVAITAVYSFFGGWRTMLVTLLGFFLTALSCILQRTTVGRLRAHAQFWDTVSTVAALICIWKLTSLTGEGRVWQLLVCSIALFYTGRALYLLRHSPVIVPILGPRHVIQWQNLGLKMSLTVRAVRTKRYRSANAVLVAVLVGLSWAASQRPQALPIDAVLIVTLLLAGTLGQEVRSLSARHYPLELVLYGLCRRWVTAGWALAFTNALICIALALGITRVWFPHDLQVGYVHVLSVGMCMVAAALLASSIVVPKKQDILSQLVSTTLYGSSAWGVLRIVNPAGGTKQLIITGGMIAVSLAITYAGEKIRWLVTIRGRYATLR